MNSIERIATESAKHVKPGQLFGAVYADEARRVEWVAMLEAWVNDDPDFEFCDDCREKLLDTIEQALPKRNRVLVADLREQIYNVLIAYAECAYQLGKAVGQRESQPKPRRVKA